MTCTGFSRKRGGASGPACRLSVRSRTTNSAFPAGYNLEAELIDVAVTGALGKMGIEVSRAVVADPELRLTGAVDKTAGGAKAYGVSVLDNIELLDAGSVDVLVDFTHAAGAVANITWALENGVHAVVGTTGIGEGELAEIADKADSGDSNVLIAPNFALGAVLMMRFAQIAATVFDQCEIIELHHRGKLDAPSGTATATAQRVAEAMDADPVPPVQEKGVEGARGGRIGPVQIHSVRLDGLVAHQEVLFGSQGQTLSIRHDTTDRTCFMPGVVMAIKAVGSLPGLTVGLEGILPTL
ncbi:MAG: 4-hydroxy-tetrahydrodipicolinate reductase [Actinobacteria bacterium]|nr:4-hydroxy-tetrahydrodipicolinate reductase [Actinomycetota bacterium]MBU4489509.1 4-hydroxy-tetrahydrodipicolinate reductase [Actinomycetota bacterium]